MQFEGVVSVLKPPGMTSSDVVVDIRRIFGERRVGHTGTLDPAAAGVLPICIGRATRLFDYLVDKEKEYIAEIRFGAETDTEDACGTVIAESSRMVSKAELEKILPDFIGEIEQVPPIYSSLSVNGVKMYKLARSGSVTAPAEERRRRIRVFCLKPFVNSNKTASSSAFDAQKAHMSVRFAGTSDGPSAAVHTCRFCCEPLPEPSISAKRIRLRN